jgi:prophage antirepressor-like protein
MTTALQTFDFKENPVRVVERSGQPWFVAADVCRVLEIGNPSLAVKGNPSRPEVGGLDEDERGVCSVNTPGGEQQHLVISESGLYSLIFKSRKPQAKAFRKWVTSEVLPAIRVTGKYEVQPDCQREEVRNIVLATLRGLRDGIVAVQKATAIFTGAKMFLCLSTDTPSAPLPDLPGESDEVKGLVGWMAAQGEGKEFTVTDLLAACEENKFLKFRRAAGDPLKSLGRLLSEFPSMLQKRKTKSGVLYSVVPA